jgi:hypothetical protein
MRTPLVLYVQKFTDNYGEGFTAVTSRKESIVGRLSQRFMCDAPKIYLSIDGVVLEAPDDVTYVQARNWMMEQIENLLGYFIIEMPD